MPSSSPSVPQQNVCDASVDYVLRHVNTIQFLIQSIEQISGAPFLRSRIKCVPTSAVSKSVSAGYIWSDAPQQGLKRGDIAILVEPLEQLVSPSALNGAATISEETASHMKPVLHSVEKNLRHELIHAFDDTRGFLDPLDCLHQACSEIRAARLSGDCFAGDEMKRGRWDLLNGGKKCVNRRAVLAVETNPICRGFSERAVEKMFPKCYFDYEPYVAPLYAMGSHGEQTFPNATISSDDLPK